MSNEARKGCRQPAPPPQSPADIRVPRRLARGGDLVVGGHRELLVLVLTNPSGYVFPPPLPIACPAGLRFL